MLFKITISLLFKEMNVIDKIVKSSITPTYVNVLWLNTKDNSINAFNKHTGNWENISGKITDPVPITGGTIQEMKGIQNPTIGQTFLVRESDETFIEGLRNTQYTYDGTGWVISKRFWKEATFIIQGVDLFGDDFFLEKFFSGTHIIINIDGNTVPVLISFDGTNYIGTAIVPEDFTTTNILMDSCKDIFGKEYTNITITKESTGEYQDTYIINIQYLNGYCSDQPAFILNLNGRYTVSPSFEDVTSIVGIILPEYGPKTSPTLLLVSTILGNKLFYSETYFIESSAPPISLKKNTAYTGYENTKELYKFIKENTEIPYSSTVLKDLPLSIVLGKKTYYGYIPCVTECEAMGKMAEIIYKFTETDIENKDDYKDFYRLLTGALHYWTSSLDGDTVYLSDGSTVPAIGEDVTNNIICVFSLTENTSPV